MNREIKFRAWDDQRHEMIDGVQPLLADPQVPSETGKPFCMAPEMGLNIIENSPRGAMGKRFWYEVEVGAIMQFTGLLDKNGKEIYEGDIVRVWHRRETDWGEDNGFHTVGLVEYSPAEFYIRGDGYSITCHFHYNDSHREVIGNIYENPELLKP